MKTRTKLFVLGILTITTFVYGDQKAAKTDVPNLAGEWETVSVLPNGNERESVMLLAGANEKLNGTYGANGAELNEVAIKDGSLQFKFDFKMQGRMLEVAVDAKPSGTDKLLGTFTVALPNREITGEWRAKRKAAKDDARWKFVHLFYFKFKEDVSEEEMAGLMKELAGLKDKIPVLKEFVVGKNVAHRTHGFQYGLISVFDKPEDLEAYEKHPEHRTVAKKILPKLVHGVSIDFVPLVSKNAKQSSSPKVDLKGKFIHAFSFKFKPDATEEKVAGLMQELADSKESIPILRELVVGKNVARNHHGFQYGEIAIFDKPEGEHEFQKHPEHRKLVPKIIPNMEMGLTLDFVPIENEQPKKDSR